MALVLLGGFNLAHVCWKFITVERKQPSKFLECVEDNFLTQLAYEPVREDGPAVCEQRRNGG